MPKFIRAAYLSKVQQIIPKAMYFTIIKITFTCIMSDINIWKSNTNQNQKSSEMRRKKPRIRNKTKIISVIKTKL